MRLQFSLETTGLSIVATGSNYSVPLALPVEVAAIDALVAAWPAFRATLPKDALVARAVPATPSLTDSKAGQAATSSSSSPRRDSTGSGGGGSVLAIGEGNAAGSSPEERLTLL